MQKIVLYTLFDITETGIIRKFDSKYLPYKTKNNIEINSEEEWRFCRRQQSNLDTLIQVLSLRTNLYNIRCESHKNISLSSHKFNKKYKKGNVWELTFEVEVNPYDSKDGKFGLVCEDLTNIPMLTNLLETTSDTYLDCHNSNVYFKTVYK